MIVLIIHFLFLLCILIRLWLFWYWSFPIAFSIDFTIPTFPLLSSRQIARYFNPTSSGVDPTCDPCLKCYRGLGTWRRVILSIFWFRCGVSEHGSFDVGSICLERLLGGCNGFPMRLLHQFCSCRMHPNHCVRIKCFFELRPSLNCINNCTQFYETS